VSADSLRDQTVSDDPKTADTAITLRPSGTLARKNETPEQLRASIEATRDRLRASLQTLEHDLGALGRWKQTVRRHPALTIGGMFVAGYLLGRLWGRR
jgi:hypothetical protein